MIQRIQTLYLALGAIALMVIAFMPVIWQGLAAELYNWFVPTTLGGIAAASAVAVWSIFMYEDRPRQRKFVLGAQLLTVLVFLIIGGGFYLAGALDVQPEGQLDWGRLLALLLPGVAYFFFWMARRAIESDIELVRSMDRLR